MAWQLSAPPQSTLHPRPLKKFYSSKILIALLWQQRVVVAKDSSQNKFPTRLHCGRSGTLRELPPKHKREGDING